MANTTAQVITLLACIVNGISCPVATVENLSVFAVVLKNRSLWTVFNTSVLCLAFTDLLIAMFIQPAFIAYQTGKYISSFACIPYFIKTKFEFWWVGLSFACVQTSPISFIARGKGTSLALITLERYFAVFKSFRYRASLSDKLSKFSNNQDGSVWAEHLNARIFNRSKFRPVPCESCLMSNTSGHSSFCPRGMGTLRIN